MTATEVKEKLSRREEARRLIKELAVFLNGQDDAARQLWYVLTALRGPDKSFDGRSLVKQATTEKLRFAFGLTPNRHSYAFVGHEAPPIEHCSFEAVVEVARNTDYHFIDHYSGAVRALFELGILDELRAEKKD